jgi:hypothetical protein
MAARAPFPTDELDFVNDERVSYDQVNKSHRLEDERGEEWEWIESARKVSSPP